MFTRNKIPEHKRKQFKCYRCNTDGLWWLTDGKHVAMSTTKNSYTSHECCGQSNVYKAKHTYETKSVEQQEIEIAEMRAMIDELFI